MSDVLAGFRHEALLYGSHRQFLDGTLDFIAGGLSASEPMLVVLAAGKIEELKQALGADAGRVQFADMADVGTNPARIIPAWSAFADEATARGGPFRGIGEPIWAERSADELVECQRHESLLNLAFAGAAGFRLLCPYDTTLGPDVLDEAHRSHPEVVTGGSAHRGRGSCRDLAEVAAPFDRPLPEPPPGFEQVPVGPESLGQVRAAVIRHGRHAGLGETRTDDLVMAVNEVVTNTIVHGGGFGTLRLWRQGSSLVCEVTDGGRITDPLAGRVRPAADDERGRGLWLATQLCDLIQVRSFDAASVVRLHMRRA